MMASMPSPTPPDITSRANPRIAAVVALRDRRERDRQGLTVVDGAREIRRALDAGADVVEVYVCEPRLAGPDARAALDAIERRALSATTVSEPVFERIAFGERAEGLLAVVRIPDLDLGRLVLSDDPLIVVIEGVEKPGNVGAILRSADGAGVDALIVSSPRTDPFNPNAIRASAGTIFSVPIAVASSEATLDWLHDHGIRPVAARVGAATPYAEADLRGPLAIVLGTEADGLSAVWADDSFESVGIPMRGVADSLNVSVSAAILLYEARRQRDRRMGGAD
jgi:RNA methyltransferase, TrmH family